MITPAIASAPARIPSAPPRIEPVADDAVRPQWSVMIPAYNCLPYLADAINSVLAQDLGPALMQIEVVDDASTDGEVAALVARLGQGRVGYFRQAQNVGSLRNFETCLNRARGHYVHLLHGDDRVVDGFYQTLGQLFVQHPQAGAAFSNYASINETGEQLAVTTPIDQAGILDNWLLRIAERQLMQYACVVVRRAVYEHLGSFYGTNYGEDWEMWVRIARHYPVAYTPAVLAEYRNHTTSISSAKARQGHIVRDLQLVMAAIQQHLPTQHRKRLLAQAQKFCAGLSVGVAYQVLEKTQDWHLAQQHFGLALAMSKHPWVYYNLFKFRVKLLLHKLHLYS
jgi:glycosyltransferase involved in cell wall biosynthesis